MPTIKRWNASTGNWEYLQLTGQDISDFVSDLQDHKADENLHFAEGEKDALQFLFWQNRKDVLKQGDMMAGYYGKVNGLITGEELETETGLTAGTLAVSDDITWLKFAHKYRTLFVADRAIRTNISWDDIQAEDLVKGKVIKIKGRQYLCRLMTGGNSNPADEAGGEWDDLIVQFTPNDEDSNWDGVRTRCQEIGSNINNRVVRGRTAVTGFDNFNSAEADSSTFSYRPVLELL